MVTKRASMVGLCACVVVLTGCGARGISTARLERSFRQSDEATQRLVAGVVESIKEQNYLAAIAGLTALELRPGLTRDQRQAIEELKQKVSERMAERVKEGSNKVGEGLKEIMGK